MGKLTIEDIVSNVNVYGLENSVRASKFPMSVDVDTCTDEIVERTHKLANAPRGSGHDNFLKGIVVQFDLTYTVKAWTEAERYHWFDIVSSQSTMHRITKFDLDKAYIHYVDRRIINIMKEKVTAYNELANAILPKDASESFIKKHQDAVSEKYLEVLYSNPCGCKLTARITTNYQQLKTMYDQRKSHRLPEWRLFCKFIESLPHSEFITNTKNN